jgi:hypothetical protein
MDFGQQQVNNQYAKEMIMSGKNGDKARFDRERKKKIARKRRSRELQKSLSQQNNEAQATNA